MRKMVLISILLLSFLFVGAVSAAPSQDIYVSVNGNDTSNTGANPSSPYATIAKGVSNVNESLNSTIHLSEGTFTGTGNVLVEINKAHQSQGGTLTIIGAGYNNTFIDAGSSANMFDIKADSIVKLVNITFINGKNTNGGTIINAGDLSISNCIFENNYATSKGGAIYSTGGNLTISDSKFKNNSAASYSGAIYATSTLFNISDSSFIGNYAKYAGAVSLGGSSDYNSTVKNSYFADNYATSNYGGSISMNYGSLINNTIINSTITGTSGQGGAVYLSGISYLKNNTMTNCTAVKGNYIYLSGNVNANITFADLTVTKPTATVTATVTDDMGHPIYGGSINFYANTISLGSANVVNGTATLTYTKLLDSNGLYNLTGGSSYFTSLSNIVNGTLTVDIDRTPVYLYVSATNGSDDTGDGSISTPYRTISKAIHEGFYKSIYPTIYILDGTYSGAGNNNITITDLGVLNLIGEYNKTIIDGGNVNWIFNFGQYTQVNLVNLTIQNGNGTSSYPVLQSSANLNMTNCIFKNNYVTSSIIIYAGGPVNIVRNLIFRDNQVSGSYYGPFYIKNGTIEDSIFINNSNTGTSGGAMWSGALSADGLVLRNSKFINNTNSLTFGSAYAGALYVTNGNLISTNNIFSNNYGRYGAVMAGITSINDKFYDNIATVSGGAFYGSGNITNATFTNNTASIYGGAIYSNQLTISNCSFTNNIAGTNGNEIYMYSSGSYIGAISVVNLTFVGNSTINITKLTGNLTATVTDDQGNSVSGGNVSFYLNGTYIGQADVINGLSTLTYIGFKNGTYNLTGTYNYAVDPVYSKYGMVNVTIKNVNDSVEYYVSKSGNDTIGDGSKDNPYATIQKALTAACDISRNITIHLLEGTYSGAGNTNVTLPGALNITLIGEGISKTVINGENTNWIFNVTLGDGLITLKDFQIINGSPVYTANPEKNSPIMIAANSTVILQDMDIRNSHGYNGGAINNNGNLTVYNSIFSNNGQSYYGGAIYNGATGILEVYNSSFINNTAKYGTALDNEGFLLIKNTLFKDNFRVAGFTGEGKAIYGFGSLINIYNCTFTNNERGDIYFASNTGNVYNSTFYNNTNYNCIFISGNANATISNCSFTNVYQAVFMQGTNMNISVVGCLFENDTYALYANNLGYCNLIVTNSVILSPVQLPGSNFNVTADYNWWGSNDKPVITGPDNLTLNYWLVMTLKSDNKPGFSKNIKAGIDHYTDGVINYAFDGYLPVREYLFSVSNGTINPVSGNLTDSVVNAVFNASSYGNYTVNATVDNQTVSCVFELFQVNSTTTVNLSNSTGKVGNKVVITVDVKDENGDPINDGEVEFFIGNTSIGKVQVVDGKAVKEWVVDGDSGEYEINARYLGSEAYLPSDNYAVFLLDAVAPVPNADVKSGLYNTTKKVTLTATDNQDSSPKIYYTTDGTTPTTESTFYKGSISISKTTILKFIAVDSAGNVSPVQTEAYTIDTAKPTITSIDPANGTTKVSASKIIKVTFSETIKAGSNFWVDLKNSSGKAVPFNYSISGKVLTIDPKSNLAESLYTLCIHTGAVTDLAGNPVAVMSTKFSVGNPPTITSTNPANNKVINTANKAIVITFSENIKAGSVFTSIKVTNPDGVSVKPLYKVINGKTLTLTRNGYYINGLTYTITLPTGSITDTAGNTINTYTSKFKVDTTKPKITSVNPANNKVINTANKAIVITFNENIKAGSAFTSIKVTNPDGVSVKPLYKVINGKTLTLTRNGNYINRLTYTITLPKGSITDTAGNTINTYTSKFTIRRT